MSSAIDVGSESGLDQHENIKADHACSACQRRKLRCDRELPPQGCSTCRKSNIPCMYTEQRSSGSPHSTTRAGRKKIRGPYRKGQTPREKELEHSVLLLTKKCSDLESQLQRITERRDSLGSDTVQGHIPRELEVSSSLSDTDMQSYVSPEPAVVLELWLRYISAVDPFTKLIHCPTISATVLSAKDQVSQPPDIEALMLSIYIASYNSLQGTEAYTKLGGSCQGLDVNYRVALENLLMQADVNADSMTFTFLQAALIHLGSLRRQAGCDESLNIGALFKLILRLAHHLRVDDLAAYSSLTPFEAEYRRRAWWTICRYRSAYAEDFSQIDIPNKYAEVALPSNYNDSDLEPGMITYPTPREGLSDLSIVLMQLKVVKLLLRLEATKQPQNDGEQATKSRVQHLILATKTEVEQEILTKCDGSRPFDWLILLAGQVILTKLEIKLLESLNEAITCAAWNSFHDKKISLALDIIECQQLIATDPRLERWQWYWKYSHQWHSTIYVLEEITRRPEASFASRAWEAIDFVMTTPNVLDKHGMNVETRIKLLESHDRALQARERLVYGRGDLLSPKSSQLRDDL